MRIKGKATLETTKKCFIGNKNVPENSDAFERDFTTVKGETVKRFARMKPQTARVSFLS